VSGNGKNGSKGSKRAPWNKGKRGVEVGAGGPDSPWKENGGPDNNQGRRPGDRNSATVEAGFRLTEFRKALTTLLSIEQFAKVVVTEALKGSAQHATIYRDCVIGRPKQTIDLDPDGAPSFGTTFRCFLSDGRPVSPGPVPVSDGPPTRR
jgi:hypothetical protein